MRYNQREMYAIKNVGGEMPHKLSAKNVTYTICPSNTLRALVLESTVRPLAALAGDAVLRGGRWSSCGRRKESKDPVLPQGMNGASTGNLGAAGATK